MLNQIISNTPTWVWALLGFLIYRGIKSSIDRELTIKAVLTIPLVMLALSAQGILSGFGDSPTILATWIVAIGLGSAISWRQVNQNSVRIHAEQGLVFYRGSWAPLIMMLAIFILKYIVNVALHLNPELHRNMQFALTCTFTFGLFNGLFLGKMAHVLVLYRRAFEATSKFPKMENIENAPR